MAKKIGYIESNKALYISVTDVFDYLREQGVIDTDQRARVYRWNFEQELVKLMYNAYKSGEKMDSEVPFIIEGSFYCSWLRFISAAMRKAIKVVRNESEFQKILWALDMGVNIRTSKLFVKKVYTIK